MEVFTNLGILIVAFAVLIKSASLFVDGSVGIAKALGIPKLVVGILLVSMATTAPEFTVSVMAAFKGEPEIALGNAVGSVICDDGLAMGLAGLVALSPIVIQPQGFRFTAIFILVMDFLVFGLALNGSIGRGEGVFFLLLLAGYFCYVLYDTKKKRNQGKAPEPEKLGVEAGSATGEAPLWKFFLKFLLGIGGVILASKFVVDSAVKLAALMGIPEVIIGLTIVAFGTSLPEMVTCVVSARKGQGEIAVGNILGADILNILWIIGMSSLVNPIQITQRQIYFMFPSMICIVGAMLLLIRIRYSFWRGKGIIMLCLYGVYLFLAVFIFV
jgi:cation:H+ antiporter